MNVAGPRTIHILHVMTEAAEQYLWAFDHHPHDAEISSVINRDLIPEEAENLSSVDTHELEIEN